MYIEPIQGYQSSDVSELVAKITQYIQSGDIKCITRVEKWTNSQSDDSVDFYNGEKKILRLASLAGGSSLLATIYTSESDSWVSPNSSALGSTKYIYRMYVLKHGLYFKTSNSNGSTNQKGCIFLTETKTGETGVFVRYSSNTGIWDGYFVAWGDQNPYTSISFAGKSHTSFTGLLPMPTCNPAGNNSVNAYFMPFTQFSSYDGLITMNGKKYYTDGSLAFLDE